MLAVAACSILALSRLPDQEPLCCAQTEDMLVAAARANSPQHGVHLDIGTFGDLNSLHWAHNPAPKPGHVECDVSYGARQYMQWCHASVIRVAGLLLVTHCPLTS